MEDINNKAYDDELNKAEDRLEGNMVDKTPLPKSKKNKPNKNKQENE